MALQRTVMKPGTIREPHWYTTGDVVLFVQKGKAFFSMMDDEGKVYNVMAKRGDIIFLPIGTFHTYVSVGAEDLEIYESFKSSEPLGEIGILDASQHFRVETLAGATGLSKESIAKIHQKEGHAYMTSL
jgi:oxalate decarboxylase